MKKRSLKRGISLLTTAALMVGLFNGQDLFVKKLEAAETVEYNAKKAGVNILPAALKNNSDFMGKYVYKEGGFNITSEFKAVSSKNIKDGLKEGEALSTKRNYWHASNNHWEASFAYDFENEDEFKYLIDTGQINYGFRTYLRSDKHSHIGSPGSHGTQWDVAILTYDEGSIFAEAKDDMVGQETTRYTLLPPYTQTLKWKMWHGGCNCGSSGVSGSSIYVVDTKNPYVESVYVTRDSEGQDVVNESEGFKADETGYFVLDFNENIRFGDNKKEELKLNLDLFYTDNNQSVTGDKVTASLVRLEDDKLIFKFTVPKKLNNKKTNVYIKSISTQQDWVGQGKSKFGYCVMDKNGKEYNVEDASKKYMTCGSRITDLAGNPVDWSSKNLSIGKVYLDCKEPELGKVELSGSMITKDSRTDISQWQTNIDRSAVFAGIGDTLNFTCTFTEELKINNLSNIKALLNIKDKDGNQVKITAKSMTNKNGRDVYGVDSAEVMVTSIDFSELLIEEGMEPLTADGKSIQIVGFEGMSDVTDLRNNKFTNINNVSIYAAQQEYLDVLAPYVSTTMSKDVNYSDKYVPSSEGGFIFTVPIAVGDDDSLGNGNYCSGIYGLNGKFSLITEDNVKHSYEWYVDNRASCNASSYSWKKGWTASDSEEASQNEFPQKGVTSYIHIKLNSAEEYAFDETYFNGTLQFETIDYAGNTKITEIPIRHDVDNQGPSIEYRNAKVTKTADGKAEMSLKLYVYDRFGVGDKITYSWYVVNNNENGEETNITGNDEIHSGEIDITSEDISEDGKNAVKDIVIPFDILEGEHNRGARIVNFTVADKKGNSSSYSKRFDFYFNEITSEYTISDNGSETDPLMKGKFNIVIKKPSKVTLDSSQASETARTMMLVPMGKESVNGIEKDTYLAFIQNDNNSDKNIFEGLPDAEGNTDYTFRNGYWYKIAGEIKEDNSGDFEIVKSYTDADVYKVGEYIYGLYGKTDIIFVTSTEISNTEFSFSADSLRNKIETDSLYIAGNTVYNVEITDVINSKEESVKDLICVDKNETKINKTVSIRSLREIFVKINMTNVSDETSNVKYNYTRIDIDKSNYTLTEVNDAKSDADKYKYTGKIEAVDEQLLSFTEDVKNTGLYKLQINVVTYDGKTYNFEPDYYLYIDKSVVEAAPYSYNKVYANKDTDSEMVTIDNVNIENKNVVKVGFGAAPSENITGDIREDNLADNRLTFKKKILNELDTSSGYEAENTIEIRAWSVMDDDGEKNAKWYDLTNSSYYYSHFDDSWITKSDDEFSYQLIMVDEFSADAYNPVISANGGASFPALPLVIGDNQVNYEIRRNGNNVVKGSIVLRAGTGVPDFYAYEYTRFSTQASINIMYSEDIKTEGGKIFWKYPTSSIISTNVPANYYRRYEQIYAEEELTIHIWESNSYGNISEYEYEVKDIDSKRPEVKLITAPSDSEADDGSDGKWGINNSGFHFMVHVKDDKYASPDNVVLTYERYYTGLLQDVPVEDRDYIGGLQFNVPVNKEGDGIWENYDDNCNGIYRTKLSNYVYSATGSEYDLEIWGEFAYDPDKAEGEETSVRIEVYAFDDAGNSDRNYCTYVGTYKNQKPVVSIDKLSESGYPVLKSYKQLKEVKGYGINNELSRNIETYDDYINCSVELPMLCIDGNYTYKYVDLFGKEYEETIPVNVYNNADIKVNYSEMNKTNQNVIVAVETVNAGDYITQINAECVDANGKSTNISGEINKVDTTKASIEMTDNGVITLKTAAGKTHTLRVANIDKTLEAASIVFSYDGVPTPTMAEGKTDTITSEATAIVNCDEEIEGINGKLHYTFPYGSKKGDTYTFEYSDEAGNIGTITATLPYNLEKSTGTLPAIDDIPPECEILLSGMRNDIYSYLTDFYSDCSGTEIADAAREYKAQRYSIKLNISDASKTKIIIKEAGNEEVTSYNDNSDIIDSVSISNTTINIKDNVAFDLYIVDEFNNVTKIKGINIDSIDKEAPLVTAVYEPIKTAEGYEGVRVWFESDNNEKIIPLDSNICAIRQDMADGQIVLKYYKDYEKNATEKFNYKDEYGNLSYVTVNVQALDTEIPVITSTTWFGIGAKAKPSELVDKVSNDVVAQIKCSKVVCQVNLYEYDENAADKKGTLISEDIPVKTEFTGKNVLVTYSDNLNRKIVVEMVASGNGRKAQKVLDAVNCIDKVSPDVTIASEEIAEDKLSKTYVFSTNEPTLFSENPSEGYATEHILKVTKNKEVSCMFTDKAGNITEKNISITEIDTIPLKLSFSINADGSNPTDTTEDMNLQVGETIYVKTNKAAQISVSDYIIDVEAEQWTAITFNIKTGLYILKATDRVTKKATFENISIQNVDILAPIIDFDTLVVVIDETATVEEMNNALHSGVSISDNRDGNITEYEVSDIPKNVKHGYYTITYTAYDESGNEATAERMLYIAYKDEPAIKLNGEKVMPYGMTVVDNNSINIDVSGTNEKGLVIKCYSGICTTGQMKYCTTPVQNGESIKLESKKYYTLYVRTKDKKEYVFYVYAE